MTGSEPYRAALAGCSLLAFGVVEATPQNLSVLRKQPGPAGEPALTPGLLNHAEDQAVAAVAAVLNAIDAGRLYGQVWTDWGAVAATCFQGRVPVAASFERYRRQGPLSVSPLIVPFMSLHSTSSMISLALRMHGPSVGVGGGRGEYIQALMTGMALQQEHGLPGVWVVATGWDPEMLPEPKSDTAGPICRALALALVPQQIGARGSTLRLLAAAEAGAPAVAASFTDLVRFLADAASADEARVWCCSVDGGHRLELTVQTAGTAVEPLAKSA
jgi:hypothetical protein